MRNLFRKCLPLLLAGPVVAIAGGSDYGTPPGALATITGEVREWPVPTPKFARDPAPAPDGSIFIAVMRGNRIARFDTKTKTFKEWDLPDGARPHGLLVDSAGIVWDAVKQAADANLVTSLSMVLPFGPAEKQALLEAADSTARVTASQRQSRIARRRAGLIRRLRRVMRSARAAIPASSSWASV